MKQFIDLTKVLKVGQKVWGSCNGWMTITGFKEPPFPIECGNNTYTRDGKIYTDDKYPSLFLEEQKINYTYESEYEIDWSKVPKDTKCIVLNFSNEYIRYFSEYLPNADNKFICYGNGCDSSKAIDTVGWEYCRIHQDVKIKKEWLK